MTIKTERLLSRAKKLYTKGNFSEAESIYLEVLKHYRFYVKEN